ncbi:MAG: cyclic nucleotide-binding domain-containing protein [Gammaproteobacteria bacterium]|nr:cyclic nucleotide-binding domain-containing protein [Gammaproteobacteria bacterium]
MTTEISVQQLSKFYPLDTLSKESLTQLSEKIKLQNLAADTLLFKKGSTNTDHFYLLEGSIDLIGDNGILKTIQSHSRAASEPVVQILPRTVTAVTSTPSQIFILNADALDLLLTWNQSGSYQVKELDSNTANNSDDWMLKLLRTEAFHRIPAANIQSIFAKMENIEVMPGEKIIQQDDEGDYFYIIISGRCLITRSVSAQTKDIKLAELSDGDSFGEEALIADCKRNASATMLTKGRLNRLSKNDFLQLLNEPSLRKVNFAAAKEMTESDNAQWIDIRLPSEYKHSHIKNSLNIPLISLRLKMKELSKNKQYIVYCDTERRSSAASFLLNESGHNSVILSNGLADVPLQQRVSDS